MPIRSAYAFPTDLSFHLANLLAASVGTVVRDSLWHSNEVGLIVQTFAAMPRRPADPAIRLEGRSDQQRRTIVEWDALGV